MDREDRTYGRIEENKVAAGLARTGCHVRAIDPESRGGARPHRRHGGAQVVPRPRLRLFLERRQIGEPRPHVARLHGGTLQLLHTRHRLAGAPVRDDAGEALAPLVERLPHLARRVIEDQGRCHVKTTSFGVSGAAGAAAVGVLPSMRSRISLPAVMSPCDALTTIARATACSMSTGGGGSGTNGCSSSCRIARRIIRLALLSSVVSSVVVINSSPVRGGGW